jgi:hypothetical protein
MAKGSPETPKLTWPAVCARRLQRHGLDTPTKEQGPDEVVGAICGAHAQVMLAAEISIGQRVAGITRGQIQAALWDEHSLVKTFGPRGTVHLLPARDLSLWSGALSALPANPSQFPAPVRLSAEQTDTLVDAIAAALADAELTVDELTAALVERCGPWAGDPVMPAFQGLWPRWRQMTAVAAQRGALCFGPNRGRTVTYTSPRRWLPDFEPMDGPAALAELVRRYLLAYGPATPQHFARWLSAPQRWATELFASLGDRLQPVELDGAPMWAAANDAAAPHEPPKGLRLLPYFDAYAVGSYPREWLFPGKAGERALAGGQAGNFPVLLIDGIVAGVWHQRRSGRRIAVTVEPLAELGSQQRRELDDQVEWLGSFLDGKPELTIGRVSVGPHA